MGLTPRTHSATSRASPAYLRIPLAVQFLTRGQLDTSRTPGRKTRVEFELICARQDLLSWGAISNVIRVRNFPSLFSMTN